jgi:heme A synthase
VIEFTHRWLAAMSTTLVVALAVVGVVRWLSARRSPGNGADVVFRRRSAQISGLVVALFCVQIVLGAVTVEFNLPGYVIAVHLANAELLLGALLLLAVRAYAEGTDRAHPVHRSPATGATMLAAAATYLLVISGSVVVAEGASAACTAWPLCGAGLELSGAQQAVLNEGHRLLAGLAVVAIGYAVMRVRRAHPAVGGLRLAGAVASALLLAQIIAGAAVVTGHLPPAARGIHLALASALWGTVAVIALLTRASPMDLRDEPLSAAPRPAGATPGVVRS